MPTKTMRRRVLSICLKVGIVVLTIAILRYFLVVRTGPPRDEQLRELFERRRADFERLRDLIVAQGPTAAVTLKGRYYPAKQHWGPWKEDDWEIATLLRSIGAERIDHGWSGDSLVVVHLYSFGIVPSSLSKNIVYSSYPSRLRTARIVTNTDKLRIPDNTEVYADIEEGWYIQVVHD